MVHCASKKTCIPELPPRNEKPDCATYYADFLFQHEKALLLSMIMRRWTFTLAIAIFCVASFLLYNSLETSSNRRKEFYEKGRVGFYCHF